MKKLILIDGNSLLFRCYYATSPYATLSSGAMATNALHILGLMTFNILEKEKPDYFIVAFDTNQPTFRHQVFKEYKAQRDGAPEDLVAQMEPARNMLRGFGACVLELPGHEADDIIGTFSKCENIEVRIYSQDKDMFQLIKDNVAVVRGDKKNEEVVNAVALLEKEGLTPSQIIEYKAIIGDSSDNIPGIKGIGEVGAKKLLSEYGTLDGIYKNIDQIKGKIKEKLLEYKEQSYISRQLVTINCAVPIDTSLSRYQFTGMDFTALQEFFQKYRLNTLLTRLQNNSVSQGDIAEATSNFKCQQVYNISDDLLCENTFIAFVCDDENYHRANIFGLCIGQEKVEYINVEDLLLDGKLLDFLQTEVKKGAYDIKETLVCARRLGITINNLTTDIVLTSYIINQSREEAAEIFAAFNLQQCYRNQLFTKRLFSREKCIDYFACLVNNCYKCYLPLLARANELGVLDLVNNMEIPLAKVLAGMELTGVEVDIFVLNQLNNQFRQQLSILEKQIHSFADKEFNIASTKELAEVLFDELGLPVNRKRSTGIEILLQLKPLHPIINLVIEYRKYHKLVSTYTEGFLEYIFPDGKFHTIYNQTVTATGRLSSQSPNLQQIAGRDERQKEVRKAIIAPAGSYIVSFDYSQIELRILAHLANDEIMISAFNQGLDIHAMTASKIFKVPLNKITPALRSNAKAVNFGILYGMSDYGLSEGTGISVAEAKSFIDSYFQNFPSIKNYLDDVVKKAQKEGVTRSMFNRLRKIPQILSAQYFIREQGIRIAKNSPIQSSAADIVKMAMLSVDEYLRKNNLKTKMIMQIHDELVFIIPLEELDCIEQIKDVLEHAAKLAVALEVHYGYGQNLYEVK